jgi:hypothetical protein
MLDKNPDEARSAMLSLFDGPLLCTPVETSEGPRFQIEGTAVIGRIFTVESSVSNSASPRGFEHCGRGTINRIRRTIPGQRVPRPPRPSRLTPRTLVKRSSRAITRDRRPTRSSRPSEMRCSGPQEPKLGTP